jgi:hypothetical protein
MVFDPKPRPGGARTTGWSGGWGRARRLTTETKQAFKTTEFWVFAAMLTALMVASWVIGDDDGGEDIFRADEAWRYATFLTIGYLISGGLAKSGSCDPYWQDGTNQERGGGGGAPANRKEPERRCSSGASTSTGGSRSTGARPAASSCRSRSRSSSRSS